MIVKTQFEKYLIDEGRADLTVKGYLSDLKLFATWFRQSNGQALTPKLLTAQDVRDYKQYLLQRKSAPATINRKLNALTAYVRWAQDAKLIEGDPTSKVKLVDQEETAPKWLTKADQGALIREAERALNAARGARKRSEIKVSQAIRNLSLIVFLIHTGLRVSEVTGLQIGDLTLSERKGKVRVRADIGKGEKERDVPLNATALSALKDWLAVRSAADHALVFTGKGGRALGHSGVQEMIAELGRVAGIEQEVTPHVLRHTFAKNLVDRGAPTDQVAKLMGHASLNTTKRYTTPSQADLERAVGLVGD